ncbi:MAG: hypothetical protein NHB32_10005 [Fischerella sp. CENA71]|nr:hypothetical protein [Fischerella sp. CENA71]
MKNICDRTFTFSIRIVKLCQFLDDKLGVERAFAQELLRINQLQSKAEKLARILGAIIISCKNPEQRHQPNS